MSDYCKLCGEILTDGKCEKDHSFKKMCVNCSFCTEKDDKMYCMNEDNMNAAVEKIKSAAAEAAGGYSITNFDIKVEPLPLKKPIAKCGKWALSAEVLNMIPSMFV